MNKKSFDKIFLILKELDYESYLFWNRLLKKFSSLKIRNRLFSNDEDYLFRLIKFNPYLKNDDSYKQTKILIEDVTPSFITKDIYDVHLNKKYDNIWLSNVGQYMNLDKLKKIIDKLYMNLNDNGKMLICYLYRLAKETKYNECWSKIYDLESVFKIFKDYNISIDSFFGVSDWEKDSVLVYKKTKR